MPNKSRLATFFLAVLFIAFFGASQKLKAVDNQKYFYPAADATVSSNAPTQNYGNYAYLETSYATGPTRQEMVYFGFDISEIPSNATITNARVWLTVKSCVGTPSPNTLNVGKVNGNWIETGINWSTRPNFSAGDSSSASCNSDRWPFEVTDTVKEWLSGASQNYGLVVYGPKSGNWERNFYSRENDNPINQPELAVYYTTPDAATNPDTTLPDDGSTGIPNPPAASTPSTSTPATGTSSVKPPVLSYVWRSGTGDKVNLSSSNEVEADTTETLTVVGTAKSGYKVSLFINGKSYTTTTNTLGYWAITFKASDFPDGKYPVEAQAKDSSGKASTKVTLFTLDKIDLEAIALQFYNEDNANSSGIDNFTGIAALSPIFGSMLNLVLCICCSCICLLLVLMVIFLFMKKGGKKKTEVETTKTVETQPGNTTETPTEKPSVPPVVTGETKSEPKP